VSTTGFIILCHERPDRAAHLASALARGGAPVAVHAALSMGRTGFADLRERLRACPEVFFAERCQVTWGQFSMVEATLRAVETLLAARPELANICLLSGDTLPLQPVPAIIGQLRDSASADLIESRPAREGGWVKGGEVMERFGHYHPFAWQRQRRLFDAASALQRRIGLRRRFPDGPQPHVGSQWWCLRSGTLRAILGDPRLPEYRRFFRSVWIPDESFFQTLVRRHSAAISGELPVFSRFDPGGQPYVFYDDHAELLARTGALFARKVWPGAEALYARFPPEDVTKKPATDVLHQALRAPPEPRPARFSQTRLPTQAIEPGMSGGRRYDVVIGAAHLAARLKSVLEKMPGLNVNGHLFARPAEFADGRPDQRGGLRSDMDIRFDMPDGFLRNLLGAGERQVFFLEPGQCRAAVECVARDPAAHLHLVTALLPERFPTLGSFRETMTMQQVVNLASLPLCRAQVGTVDPSPFSGESELIGDIAARITQNDPAMERGEGA
jgi:hypothetical protein